MPKKNKQDLLAYLAKLDAADFSDFEDEEDEDIDDEAAEYLYDREAEEDERDQEELRRAQEAEDAKAAKQKEGEEWLKDEDARRKQIQQQLTGLDSELLQLEKSDLAGASAEEVQSVQSAVAQAKLAVKNGVAKGEAEAARQAVEDVKKAIQGAKGEIDKRRNALKEMQKLLGAPQAGAGADPDEQQAVTTAASEASKVLASGLSTPTPDVVKEAETAVAEVKKKVEEVDKRIAARKADVPGLKNRLAGPAKGPPPGADESEVGALGQLVSRADKAVGTAEQQPTTANVEAAKQAVEAVENKVKEVLASIEGRAKKLQEQHAALKGYLSLDRAGATKDEDMAVGGLVDTAVKALENADKAPTTKNVEDATTTVAAVKTKIEKVQANAGARKLLGQDLDKLLTVDIKGRTPEEFAGLKQLLEQAKSAIAGVDGDPTAAKGALTTLEERLKVIQGNIAKRADLKKLEAELDGLPATVDTNQMIASETDQLQKLDEAARKAIAAALKDPSEGAINQAKQEVQAVKNALDLIKQQVAVRNQPKTYKGTVKRSQADGSLKISLDQSTGNYNRLIPIAENTHDAGLDDVVEFTLVTANKFDSGAKITAITKKADPDYGPTMPYDTANWTWAGTALQHINDPGYNPALRDQNGVKTYLKAHRGAIQKSPNEQIYYVPTGSTTPNLPLPNKVIRFHYYPAQNRIHVFHIQ